MKNEDQNKTNSAPQKNRRFWWFGGGILAGLIVGATGMWQAGKLYVPPTERGIRQYKNGELDKAAKTLLSAAEDGDGLAQYWLAHCLLEKGGDNTGDALRWLRSAAEKGTVQVKVELAKMLLEGENAEQNT